MQNLEFLILSIIASYLPVYYIPSFKTPPPSCHRKKTLKIPALLGLIGCTDDKVTIIPLLVSFS